MAQSAQTLSFAPEMNVSDFEKYVSEILILFEKTVDKRLKLSKTEFLELDCLFEKLNGIYQEAKQTGESESSSLIQVLRSDHIRQDKCEKAVTDTVSPNGLEEIYNIVRNQMVNMSNFTSDLINRFQNFVNKPTVVNIAIDKHESSSMIGNVEQPDLAANSTFADMTRRNILISNETETNIQHEKK